MKRPIAIGLAIALVMAACGDSSEKETLVIYSGRAEELVADLFADFTETTGIQLEVRYAGSTDLAATLLEERDNTTADVFFSQDPASLGAVAEMLSPLPDDILALVDPRFSDRTARWVGVSGRVRSFIYHTDSGIDPPATLDDVTDPEWAGQIGVAPTNSSFLAFVAAMILERGEAATLAWLQALAANNPQDFPNNATMVEAADNGEIMGGLTNHYYLHRLQAEGAGLGAENWYIPDGGVGTLMMPAGVGILSATESSETALRFLEYLLSEAAQRFFAEETFEIPLVEGVSPAPGVPSADDIRIPDIDLSRLAEVLEDATRLVAQAGLV